MGSVLTAIRRQRIPITGDRSFLSRPFATVTSRLLLVIALCLSVFPSSASAFDDSLEKDLQDNLVRSKALVETIVVKLARNASVSSEIAELKTTAENVRITDLLLEERFKLGEEKAKSLGTKALERHQAMAEGYRAALTEYLSIVDTIPSGEPVPQSAINNLQSLLEKILPKKRRPIIGSLPYKHLNLPAIEPSDGPEIIPAYRGGNKVVSPGDTKSTDEAPVSREIAALAQSLDWQPTAIYEYVKNNIETEWYWGCRKGAEETLRQKSGNDCDQATLLAALLRASGFPTRYVRGTVEFFASDGKPLDRVKNLTGIDDPAKIASFFQKSGVPYKPVIAGGAIANFRIEHLWVESLIPYANYRGVVIDEHGKTWLGLDTSIKVAGYAYNTAPDVLQKPGIGSQLSGVRDEYLGLASSGTGSTPFELNQTPLEYLKAKIEEQSAIQNPQSAMQYEDFLRTRTLVPEVLDILPASLQFTLIKATNEYTSMPDDLMHKVKFTAVDPDNNELFTITLPLSRLGNQQIAVTFEPETVEDQEIIDSYGGLDNTPAYLVRLRPVLTVNNERIIVARDGLPMGADYELTMELYSPSASGGTAPAEAVTNTMITGNFSVIGITAGKAVLRENTAGSTQGAETTQEKDAERLLYEEANHYIDRWNQAEDELASLLHLTVARPLPAVVTVGGMIDVTYLLDMPHGFTWKGVYVDADVRAVETEESRQQGADSSAEVNPGREFMRLSSLQGSILENRIFEDDFKVESISTAKLLQLCTSNSVPCTGTISIDKTNIDAVLPALPFDDNVKEDMVNAVNQGYELRTPNSELVYRDWTGVGYLKENPDTGESGWMLSGSIAGGMTAWGLDTWPDVMLGILGNTYSEPPNYDPSSAQYIQKIAATDQQNGTVGMPLLRDLQVKVTDSAHHAVANVPVTFTVRAGGGIFPNGSTTIMAVTGNTGIASVQFTLGRQTTANPTFMQMTEGGLVNPYGEIIQVGENIVDADLSSGLKITMPFTAYGFPKDPDHLTPFYPLGEVLGIALDFSGYVAVGIEDEFDNPVSNVPVTFTATDPVPSQADCPLSLDSRKTYLTKTSLSCIKDIPTWGTCGDSLASSLTVSTDYTGAAAYVILGGEANAIYTVTAMAAGFSTSFTFNTGNTYYGMLCQNNHYPLRDLNLGYLYTTDQYGNNINAGKTGTTIPVKARLYYVLEDDQQTQRSSTCNENGQTSVLTCPNQLAGTGHLSTTTEFLSSLISFSGTPGTDQGGGIYTADYTLKPGLNNIAIRGEATISINSSQMSCPSSCILEQGVPWYQDTGVAFMQVYGVDITVDPVPLILINKQGYAVQDSVITYTITPAEYKAVSTYTIIYKNGDAIAYITSGKQGQGTATIGRGFKFDVNIPYYAQVVLNYGTGVEIRSEKMPLTLAGLGRPFSLDRSWRLSRFDDPVPGALTSSYADSFETFTFSLPVDADAAVKILDSDLAERTVLVPDATLTAGEHKFLVDYSSIRSAGFDPSTSPNFYVLLEVTARSGEALKSMLYPGRLYQRTDGKMLGQTLVHDVLIQDGSLNLTRQDMALKGRGPQLAFSRGYNNQPSPTGFKPLGEGWSQSLDMRLRLGTDASGSEPLWAVNERGTFYTASDEPPSLGPWSVVEVNGTIFKKNGSTWYAERGRHGSLVETSTGYVYTAKDGTSYFYPYTPTTESQVQRIEDRSGNAMVFTYDGLKRLSTVTDAVGRSLQFTYDQLPDTIGLENTRLMKVTGPDDIEIDFTYNDKGYLASAKRADRIEYYAYQSQPGSPGYYNLVKTTDADAHSYAYTYYGLNEIAPGPALMAYLRVLDSTDVVKTVMYPDGNSASFVYDVQTAANKRTVVDLRQNSTTYTLNNYGNPLKIDEPLGKTTLMTWSIDQGLPDNVMTSKTDARGNTTGYQYDAKGNITQETDPYGNSITTTWNQAFSLPLSRTDRNGVSRTWEYDDRGNLLTRTDGDLKQTTYTYYPTGEIKTKTDPRSYGTSYTYDRYGNPASIAEPEGSITYFTCDVRGRLTSETDPNGKTTTYTYDPLDYPATIVHPDITAYTLPAGSSTTQTFDYDPVGNLLSETNRNGLVLSYTYTPRNQVFTVSRNTGGKKTFSYDPNGNLLTETDWKNQGISHTYDALNRRVSTTNRLNVTMYMGYDLNGNLASVTDYQGNTTTYEYDKLNRQTDIWQPVLDGQQEQGHVVKTYYNEADPKTNLKTETDQEGNTTIYTYNGRYLPATRTNAFEDDYSWTYDDSGNLHSETDEEQNTTVYDYDRQNRRTVMHKTLSGRDIKTRYAYDLNGNRTHVIDPLNQDRETKYDAWNRPWQVIVPGGFKTTTVYDGEGNPVSKTDGNNHARTWQRDAQGRVVIATDALQKTTSYTYDQNDNVLTVTDPLQTVTKTDYDAEDRPTTITEALGTPDERSKAFLARDGMGNPTRVRDYNGNVTAMGYNALNLPKSVCDPAPFDNDCTTTTYYRTGKKKTVTNRRGYTTQYEYDVLNRESKVTDPLNLTIVTTYDRVGHVKTKKDKRGIVTENFYDALYRLTETRRAGMRLVTDEYDDAGNKTATIDADGNRTTYAYNDRNLLVTTTYPDGTTETRTYDGVGNVLTVTNEEGRVTTSVYDPENRRTSVEFAGEKTQTAYDALGNVLSITRPLGNRRAMDYDRLSRLITVTDDPDGLHLATSYVYDANGNLRHQYDPRGDDVEFTYDSLNRKTSQIQHKVSGDLTTRYAYDEEGNLTGMSDPKEQSFTYTYDELNRRTDETYPADTLTPYLTIAEVHTDYDGNNNVTAVKETKYATDNSTLIDTTTNTYDDFDRLAGSDERGKTITYAYDPNGNRTLVSSPTGSAGYTYDARNRLETASDGTTTTSFTYYPDGKKDTVAYPNGTDEKYAYYDTNRIKTIVNEKTDGTVISSYAYEYDHNGNRTSQTEVQEGAAETTAYTYDTLDRLTSYLVTDGTGTATRTEYTFEGYNRKTEEVTKNGTFLSDKTYTYDETDWLTKVEDNVNGRTVNYAYDRNGNTMLKTDSLSPDRNLSFVYDSLNRLVQTTGSNNSILGLYDYNSDGLRIRHRHSDRGDIDYYYDGKSVIDEYDATSNSFLAHYRYADRLLDLHTLAGIQYYLHDGLGSTVNLTDTQGATQVSYRLDPWGHIKSQNGSSINRHIFTGKEYDFNTGLTYFGARYYDADTARFITQDTYLGEQNTPPSLHRYLYAYSNPTVYIDLIGYASQIVYDRLEDVPVGAQYREYDERFYIVDRSAYEENDDTGYGVVLAVTKESETKVKEAPLWKRILDKITPASFEKFTKESRKSGELLKEKIQRSKQSCDGDAVACAEKLSRSQAQAIEGFSELAEQAGRAGLAGLEAADDVSNVLGVAGVIKHVGSKILRKGLAEGAEELVERKARREVTEEISETAVKTAKDIGEYKDVAGHHVHAKAAFKEVVAYDSQKGFSISQSMMEERGWSHSKMTAAQRRLFKDLAESGMPNTMKEHTRIAVEALVESGADRAEARQLVSQSLKKLRGQGVRAPSNIPWYK